MSVVPNVVVLRKDFHPFHIAVGPAPSCFAIEEKVNKLWNKWHEQKSN